MFVVLTLAGLALAGCSSNSQNDTNADSMMTDSNMIDTAAGTDSTMMVDSALKSNDPVVTDTPGGGSTPAPQQ